MVFEKIVTGKLSHFLVDKSASFFSVCVSEGSANMRCFAYIVTQTTGCLGQGHGGKTCSVELLSCI